MIIICKNCKKEFKTSHSDRKHCSRKCYSITKKGIKPPYSFTSETAKKYGFQKNNIFGFSKGYTPWNKGLRTGISGMFGKKHSPESLKKMSENNARFWKGKKFSVLHKLRLSFNHVDLNDEKSPNWKGNSVGNVALHQWVSKHLGKPKECSLCGAKDKKCYDWANKDHKYRRNLNDWMRVCRSCHRNYDIEFNGYTNPRYRK